MSIIPLFKASIVVIALFLFSLIVTACDREEIAIPQVIHIDPGNETGTSMATVVGDVPLVYTNQVFPFDSTGHLPENTDFAAQVNQVLTNIETALEAAGTNLEALVRLHVYLADDELSEMVLQSLVDFLPNRARPAITFVSGKPTRSGVLVSMDAVTVAPITSVTGRVSLFRADGLYGAENRSHAAVLSPGRKIFIAGQAEIAEDLQSAVQATMRGLMATLAYAGAIAEDIVQIKAFINPVENAELIEQEIANFFRYGDAPPIVTLEWQHESLPAEIELIASAPADPRAEASVSYYAPNWMTQMTTFSRIVDVHRGGLLFTSGLYGESGQDGDEQARTIFDNLSRLLDEADSDYDHLVKGTYYPSTEEGRQGLLNVRTDFYNPDRPPAASLAEIEGSGRPGRTLNVDMISVIPE